MGNLIPEKTFDAQMHIIRDVHFDVDKYKVGELYVINLKDPGYLSVQNKTIGQLREVKEHELKFKVLALNYDHRTGDSYNTYSIGGLRFTIDDILERRIEIERLLTETEAAIYLASEFVKESAEDLFKSQLAWQKGPVGVNYFCTPEKYQDDTSKECAKDIETKQSTLDPKDPKFNRLLGIVPDRSQFPYTLERTHSYQELQAAYKINTPEEAEELAENSMLEIAEEAYDSSLDEYRNYTVDIPEMGGPFSFLNINWKFNTKAFENLCGKIEVTFRKGSNQICFNTSNKFIFVTEDTIRILNKHGLNVTIYNNDFRESFDKIEFKVIQ